MYITAANWRVSLEFLSRLKIRHFRVMMHSDIGFFVEIFKTMLKRVHFAVRYSFMDYGDVTEAYKDQVHMEKVKDDNNCNKNICFRIRKFHD